MGDPLEEESKQGAIVSKIHFDKIMGCIETAKQEGGKISPRSETKPGGQVGQQKKRNRAEKEWGTRNSLFFTARFSRRIFLYI